MPPERVVRRVGDVERAGLQERAGDLDRDALPGGAGEREPGVLAGRADGRGGGATGQRLSGHDRDRRRDADVARHVVDGERDGAGGGIRGVQLQRVGAVRVQRGAVEEGVLREAAGLQHRAAGTQDRHRAARQRGRGDGDGDRWPMVPANVIEGVLAGRRDRRRAGRGRRGGRQRDRLPRDVGGDVVDGEAGATGAGARRVDDELVGAGGRHVQRVDEAGRGAVGRRQLPSCDPSGFSSRRSTAAYVLPAILMETLWPETAGNVSAPLMPGEDVVTVCVPGCSPAWPAPGRRCRGRRPSP